MQLTTIKTQTTWSEAAAGINENNQKISIALQKVSEKMVGYYVNTSSLQTAHPIGAVGMFAYIGTTAPFSIYIWNGTSWEDSGETGGNEQLEGFIRNDTDGVIRGDLDVSNLWVDKDIEAAGEIKSDSIKTNSIDASNAQISDIYSQGTVQAGSIIASTIESPNNSIYVYGTLLTDEIKVEGGVSDEILMADGSLAKVYELGALTASDSTDTNDYEEMF